MGAENNFIFSINVFVLPPGVTAPLAPPFSPHGGETKLHSKYFSLFRDLSSSVIIIQYSVWRQVQSLFQNDSSTWCDPKPRLLQQEK